MKNEGASSPVERALWFVANRLEGEISIQSIAESAGVAEHHLARQRELAFKLARDQQAG